MAAGTRDLTTKGSAATGLGSVFPITKTIDFADIVAVKGAAIEANEIAQVLSIPAGTYLTGVMVEIVTAGVGSTLTAQVGDGDNALGFIGTSDLTAAAGTVYGPANTLTEGSPNVASPAYFGGKAYATADTLDIKVIGYNTVTALPVVTITAMCARIGG